MRTHFSDDHSALGKVTAPTIRACLWLSGDVLNPSEITAQLAMDATETGHRGELRDGPRPPVPKTFWKLVHEERSLSIDSALSCLLDKLWANKEVVRKIGHMRDCKGDFVINVHIEHDRPEYCLQPGTLARLAFFGFELCIDIFDVSS